MSDDRSNGPYIIESGRRLSASLLWRILRDYYGAQALDAWKDSTIPFHVTSNPLIAAAYARVALAYQQDLADQNGVPTQPLVILELGAGSGEFCFHFLTQYQALRQKSASPDLPFVYVMSDFAADTVERWRNQRALVPFVKAGLLDFACFDPLADGSLTLLNSGRVLSPTAPEPLIAIANYLFDSLPQDLFGIEDGHLFEVALTILSDQRDPDFRERSTLSRLNFEYSYHPLEEACYDDPIIEEVLQRYHHLEGEVVRFPIGALRCCRTLVDLAGSDLLLISADRGFVHAQELKSSDVEPLFRIHDGAFSMPVNFHSVGEFVRAVGGDVLRPSRLHRSLCVSAFMTQPVECRQATQSAFDEAVVRFGPDDASTLVYWLYAHADELSVNEIIALFRFTRHDVLALKRSLKRLDASVESMSDAEKETVGREIDLVWGNYFHQGDRVNLPFELGTFFQRMGRMQQALFYYAQARLYYGDAPQTLYNMAVCHHQLGEADCARILLSEADGLAMPGPSLIRQHYQRRVELLRAAIG